MYAAWNALVLCDAKLAIEYLIIYVAKAQPKWKFVLRTLKIEVFNDVINSLNGKICIL